MMQDLNSFDVVITSFDVVMTSFDVVRTLFDVVNSFDVSYHSETLVDRSFHVENFDVVNRMLDVSYSSLITL